MRESLKVRLTMIIGGLLLAVGVIGFVAGVEPVGSGYGLPIMLIKAAATIPMIYAGGRLISYSELVMGYGSTEEPNAKAAAEAECGQASGVCGVQISGRDTVQYFSCAYQCGDLKEQHLEIKMPVRAGTRNRAKRKTKYS